MINGLVKVSLIIIFLPPLVHLATSSSPDEEIVFRVFNGKPAVLGTVPYQVGLKAPISRRRYRTFCGGAIIAESKILSAGHCFEKQGNTCQKAFRKVQLKNLDHLYAVAGTLFNTGIYVKDGKSSEQWRKVARVHLASGYWFPTDDIAIVFTDQPYVFNDHVKALPIASKPMDYGPIECLASGYGRINEQTSSEILLWAKLRLIRASVCSKIHKKNMADFICTAADKTNVLQGDSGGPLVCRGTGDPNDKGQGVIVGVVSGAVIHQKTQKYNTFFTRVTSYADFVNSNKGTITVPPFYILWLSIIIQFYFYNTVSISKWNRRSHRLLKNKT